MGIDWCSLDAQDPLGKISRAWLRRVCDGFRAFILSKPFAGDGLRRRQVRRVSK